MSNRTPIKIPILGFEKWLLTARGKRALAAIKTAIGKDEEYAKNCLWWAFHAGNSSDQIWMNSEIEQILKDIPMDSRLSRSLKSRIKYVLDNKKDYSLENITHDTRTDKKT